MFSYKWPFQIQQNALSSKCRLGRRKHVETAQVGNIMLFCIRTNGKTWYWRRAKLTVTFDVRSKTLELSFQCICGAFIVSLLRKIFFSFLNEPVLLHEIEKLITERKASRRSTQKASFYSYMGKQNNIITRKILILVMWFIEKKKEFISRCRINIRGEPARPWRFSTAYFSNVFKDTYLKLPHNISTGL